MKPSIELKNPQELKDYARIKNRGYKYATLVKVLTNMFINGRLHLHFTEIGTLYKALVLKYHKEATKTILKYRYKPKT